MLVVWVAGKDRVPLLIARRNLIQPLDLGEGEAKGAARLAQAQLENHVCAWVLGTDLQLRRIIANFLVLHQGSITYNLSIHLRLNHDLL